MVDIARLGLEIDSRGVVKAKKELKELSREGRKTERSTDGVKKSFIGLKTAVSALGLGILGREILNTNRRFESLRTSLITTTGSAEAANIAFKGIQEFAATTPFAVEEVTQAFIKLGNLGLAPSERALISYGNTAGAMGKSLDQLVEAVADATTGEFERLKEFGIKSKSEGDRVTFTFRGVKTEVGKNAKEIQDFLIGLGETEFAGGMERQANTLNGAISNLGDSWDAFMDAILSEERQSQLSKVFRFIGSGIDFITGKLQPASDFSVLSESLRDAQKELDHLIEQFNRPRLFRINPFETTEDLGIRFDEQRAKVLALREELAGLMITSGDVGPTFDTVAESLEKTGEAVGPELITKLTETDQKYMEFIESILDEQIKVAEQQRATYRDLSSSLKEETLQLSLSNKERFVRNNLLRLGTEATDEQKEAIRRLSEAQFDERERLEAITEAANEQQDQFEELQDTIKGWGRDFADTLLDSEGSFSDFASGIIRQLQRIALSQAFDPLFESFAGIISGGIGGLFSGSPAPAIPKGGGAIHVSSYEGGGFTGSGSRSGGIDGRGGFPAILHPNETVIDHTKGGGSTSIVVNVDASGSSVQGDDASANELGRRMGAAVKSIIIEEQLPGGLLA